MVLLKLDQRRRAARLLPAAHAASSKTPSPAWRFPKMWFKATESGTFDLVCAELCGWGHYKMKGRLFGAEARSDYERLKLKKLEARRRNTTNESKESRIYEGFVDF